MDNFSYTSNLLKPLFYCFISSPTAYSFSFVLGQHFIKAIVSIAAPHIMYLLISVKFDLPGH